MKGDPSIRNDSASLESYGSHARHVAGTQARAVWLRPLAELDAPRFRSMFEGVLLQDLDPYTWDPMAPDRLEAVRQLSRFDDDDACTVLMRACFRGRVSFAEWVAAHALTPGAIPPQPDPLNTLADEWRWRFPWEWRWRFPWEWRWRFPWEWRCC